MHRKRRARMSEATCGKTCRMSLVLSAYKDALLDWGGNLDRVLAGDRQPNERAIIAGAGRRAFEIERKTLHAGRSRADELGQWECPLARRAFSKQIEFRVGRPHDLYDDL